MNAKSIIELLVADSRLAEYCGTFEYYLTDEGNTNYELIDNFFDSCVNLLGFPQDGQTYVYQYSDTCETTFSNMPDVVVILADGRCVFLYEIA